MWFAIFFIAFAFALFSGIAKAKAEILLPINGLIKVSAPAEISGFTNPSSPDLVEKNCQSLLSPTPQTGNSALTKGTNKVWNRRNAGPGEQQIIDAIKAYRRCARKVALDELAKN
ncbi:MAG TPA: hypothetical protein PKI93_00505 [Alphaproteobacteria bacterium]|nr:hypothetical protein [Alphaproteobacteria bacterium]